MILQIRRALAACSLIAFVTLGLIADQDSPRPKISGISHVRIRVSDFCKGKDFYSIVLGQHPYCPDDKEPIGGSVALHSSQMIGLNLNSLNSGTPVEQPSLLEEVGFITDDVPGLQRYLTAHNIAVSEIRERPPSFTVRDPEGHRISFTERSAASAQLRSDIPFQPRIIHAGFVVHNRSAEDKFYKDILGFHVYWHGGMKDGETDWVDMQVPDGTDWIEYMLNVSPNAGKKELGVMNHVALGVPDIKAAREQLLKNGMKLTEEPQTGRDGKWQLNLYDPDDTRVEFMEFTPIQKPCCSPYTGPHPKP